MVWVKIINPLVLQLEIKLYLQFRSFAAKKALTSFSIATFWF